MFRFLQRKPRGHEVYFLEDDYCQQQLLPRAATAHANAEIKKIDEFAAAHRVPGGMGWTDIYVRKEAPVELRTLRMKKDDLAAVISPILPAFEVVYTGATLDWKPCQNTGGWGTSMQCAVFADWDDEGTVLNVWTAFFEPDEESIRAATKVVAALAKVHPLVYVDWAWNYTCDAADEAAFASQLRMKVQTIAERLKKPEKD